MVPIAKLSYLRLSLIVSDIVLYTRSQVSASVQLGVFLDMLTMLKVIKWIHPFVSKSYPVLKARISTMPSLSSSISCL